MKTSIAILLLIVSVLTVGGFAFAKTKGDYRGSEGHMSWMKERASDKLNLTENQQARLETLFDTLTALRDGMRQSRQETHQELSELLSAPQLDRAEAQALLNERHAAMSASSQDVLNAFADFSDNLTAEQRDELADWIGDFRPHRFGHMHGHF